MVWNIVAQNSVEDYITTISLSSLFDLEEAVLICCLEYRLEVQELNNCTIVVVLVQGS